MTATNTKNNNETFLDDIIREAGYRKCIILDGNVRDLFDDGKKHYLPLPKVLLARLAAKEHDDSQLWFTICGSWDRIDGLTFMNPMMQKAFERAMKNSAPAAASCACPASKSNKEYDDGNSDKPADKGSTGQAIFKQSEEAFPAMRRVLSHESERAVFILNWQEYMVGNPTHHELAERQSLTILGKAINGRPPGQTGSDALKGSTGLLVIITSSLASLPVSLYKDNSRTTVITVPKPDRPQRLAFLTQNQRDLHVTEPKPAPGQPVCRYSSDEATLSQMADLCDGLTIIDMCNLLALSCQSASKMRPGRLVNLYKFSKHHSPWEDLDSQRLNNAAKELSKRVIGQDPAIDAAVTILKKSFLGLAGTDRSTDKKKPKGRLFFVGPPGVGKTELAKAIAEFLFGDENACIRFDMSEYSHEHDDQRLIGAPPGYVGFEQGGQLTDAVRQRPFCVLLLDEIEKAHGRILDKFLQVLEDGRLTDGHGQTVYFGEALLIFTSNIGSAQADPDLDPAGHEAHFREMVTDFFRNPSSAGGLGRPELLNRLGENNIIVFNHIKDPSIRRKIFRTKLRILEETLRERYGVQFEVSDACLNWLGTRSKSSGNGRDLVNIIESDLTNYLATFLFGHQHQLKAGRVVSADVPAGQNEIKFEIREGNQDETEQ